MHNDLTPMANLASWFSITVAGQTRRFETLEELHEHIEELKKEVEGYFRIDMTGVLQGGRLVICHAILR